MPALAGGFLNRLRPATDAGTDADLLGRFVGTRDADAFAEIVRRHGPMVLAVCRRSLGDTPDADDAHQIAFMALARDAGRIGNRHALAGWLLKVAHLSARKLAGRVHRRKPQSLTTDPATPMTPAPENDVRAVIDEEMLALPERFRVVAVMCLAEGRTNTEAAALLGIPKGTVDSRLSTAKAKLRARLTKRGIAAGLVLAEQVLTADVAAAAGRAATLAASVATLALDYAAGTPAAGTEHLFHTANGVRPMGTKLKWLVAAIFTTALAGGGGAGVWMANAADKPTPTADAKADPKKPPEAKPKEPPAETKPGEKGDVKTADDVQKALKAEVTIPDDLQKLGDVFELIESQHGLNIRLDTDAFRRRGWGEGDPNYDDLQQGVYNAGVKAKGLKRVPVEDALRELLAQVRGSSSNGPHMLSYRIKGNTVLIVPEYKPAALPGSGRTPDGPQLLVTPAQLAEDLYGAPVTVRYKKRLLAEVIEDLQERTGANIVLNTKSLPEPEKVFVTANFNDVRLLTALKIVGDVAGLKLAVVDNVYYLTDEAKAAEFEREMHRDLFGKPADLPKE